MIGANELERRRKIGDAIRGRKRPDLAAYNRSEAGRARARAHTMSAESRDAVAAAKTTHGQSRNRREGRGASKTYYVWAAMVQRCTNPNNKDFYLYGARGIGVCDAWRRFADFFADMGEKPDGLMLDRIDNEGDYEPGNCRWATPKQQANNTRKRMLTAAEIAWVHANPDMTLAQIASALGVGATTIGRVRRGEGRFA